MKGWWRTVEDVELATVAGTLGMMVWGTLGTGEVPFSAVARQSGVDS